MNGFGWLGAASAGQAGVESAKTLEDILRQRQLLGIRERESAEALTTSRTQRALSLISMGREREAADILGVPDVSDPLYRKLAAELYGRMYESQFKPPETLQGLAARLLTPAPTLPFDPRVIEQGLTRAVGGAPQAPTTFGEVRGTVPGRPQPPQVDPERLLDYLAGKTPREREFGRLLGLPPERRTPEEESLVRSYLLEIKETPDPVKRVIGKAAEVGLGSLSETERDIYNTWRTAQITPSEVLKERIDVMTARLEVMNAQLDLSKRRLEEVEKPKVAPGVAAQEAEVVNKLEQRIGDVRKRLQERLGRELYTVPVGKRPEKEASFRREALDEIEGIVSSFRGQVPEDKLARRLEQERKALRPPLATVPKLVIPGR